MSSTLHMHTHEHTHAQIYTHTPSFISLWQLGIVSDLVAQRLKEGGQSSKFLQAKQ